MAIVWGSVAGSGSGQARIGIALSKSSTDSKTTVTAKCYFWSKYSVSDSSNTFYANWSTSATTSKGSVTIKTTDDSGSGWSTSNQKLIATYTKTYTRTASAQTSNFAIKLTGIDVIGSTMTATTSISVPALEKVKVTFNRNSHGDATESTYVTKNSTLKLPSSWGSVTGYTFSGWKSGNTSKVYSGGTTVTITSSVVFYAQWTPKIYTLTITSNGDTADDVELNKSHASETHTIPVSKVYEKYGVGFYSDSACTKKITTIGMPYVNIAYTCTNITPTGGTRAIKAKLTATNLIGVGGIFATNGTITASSTLYSANATLTCVYPNTPILNFVEQYGQVISGYLFKGYGSWEISGSVPYGRATPTNVSTLAGVWTDIATVYVKVSGAWKRGFLFVKEDDVWKTNTSLSTAIGNATYIKVSGTWKHQANRT